MANDFQLAVTEPASQAPQLALVWLAAALLSDYLMSYKVKSTRWVKSSCLVWPTCMELHSTRAMGRPRYPLNISFRTSKGCCVMLWKTTKVLWKWQWCIQTNRQGLARTNKHQIKAIMKSGASDPYTKVFTTCSLLLFIYLSFMLVGAYEN